MVPTAVSPTSDGPTADQPSTEANPSASRVRRGWRWADLMRRVFAIDVLAYARCGGRLRFIATLEASETTRRILRHLDLPTAVPPTPARAPPGSDDCTV